MFESVLIHYATMIVHWQNHPVSLQEDLVMAGKSLNLVCKPIALAFVPLACDLQTCLCMGQSFELKGSKVGDDEELIDL